MICVVVTPIANQSVKNTKIAQIANVVAIANALIMLCAKGRKEMGIFVRITQSVIVSIACRKTKSALAFPKSLFQV
jgi:hypothetical protein